MALVDGFFGFAHEHPHLWTAILDHRLPPDGGLTEADETGWALLTRIVVEEIARAIACEVDDEVAALSRSLGATVHGHCAFAISGAWALMGEAAPEAAAPARVREALSARSAARPAI